MNICKRRMLKKLIHIVNRVKCCYAVNKIENVTHLNDINPLSVKI